jgi:chromatin-remodeling ATPase INO80
LGKTVQIIALLTHIANSLDIWGPFLIISPSSTLHNWQQEIEKFSPCFRVLPYWGNVNDRKILRKFWKADHIYTKDSPFHILVTSYGLIVEGMINK